MAAPDDIQSPAIGALSSDSGNDSNESFFEHGPAGGGVGQALFAAMRGPAAERQGPPQRKRSLEALLREAVSALGQDTPAAWGQGDEQQDLVHKRGPHKAARQSVLLTSQHDIGVRYGIARKIAIAKGNRHWATDWALNEYPDMCRTRKARDQFLKNARRWSKKARHGVYGCRDGVSMAENADAADRAASSQGKYEHHRSGQGTGSVRVKFSRRKRGAGAGGPGTMKMACLGEELFSWFVDTLNNVKGRLRSCLLLQRAGVVAKDLMGIHQQRVEAGVVPPHAKLNLPIIDYSWLRRWRRTYGVSARMANLRFKAPKSVILHRLRVFWCNMIRVRALHALLEAEGELVMQGFDQKPLWFTASSQEKTMALRGSRKVVSRRACP